MDLLGLEYNSQWELLICMQHQYGLCPSGVEKHLRRHHKAKGEQLRRALEEVSRLQLRPVSAFTQPQLLVEPIFGLACLSGFQCMLPDCDRGPGSLSQTRRVVREHQRRTHSAPDQRTAQGRQHADRTSSDRHEEAAIAHIVLQSFFPPPNYMPFVVQRAQEREPHAVTHQDDALARARRDYASSQSVANTPRDTVPEEPYKSQIPPWLHETGAAQLLSGCSKQALADLRNANNSRGAEQPLFAPLSDSIQRQLRLLRDKTIPGKTGVRLSRVSLRRLNSFEPGRMQTKPFKPLQNTSTLDAYAQAWSRLIFMSICMRRKLHGADELDGRFTDFDDETGRQIDLVFDCLQTTLHTDRKGRDGSTSDEEGQSDSIHDQSPPPPYPPTLNRPARAPSRSDTLERSRHRDLYDGSEQPVDRARNLAETTYSHPGQIHTHATHASVPAPTASPGPEIGQPIARPCTLDQAVTALSVHLVCQELSESAFNSPVLRFCAINTMSKEGNWETAWDTAPLLSKLIHCMQLWLVGSCLEPDGDPDDDIRRLDQRVQSACTRFLVNDSSSPIAELSHWRLLAWTASKDTVTFPTTTINETQDCVQHQDISLSLSAWRKGLQSALEDASTILNRDLLLGLHAAPQHRVIDLCDSPTVVTPDYSFLDDARNQLDAARNWLFKQWEARWTKKVPGWGERFLISKPVRGGQNSWQYVTADFMTYQDANQRFLRLLALMIYMGSGLPPRRDELVGMTWRNTETPRSIYLSHGMVALIGGYHKAQWRVGTRPVARFLPSTIGDLLVRYLILVQRFLGFTYSCMQSERAAAYLFSSDASGPWNPQTLGTSLQNGCKQYIGVALTSRQWRHIAIALDRRVLQGVGCEAFRISPDARQGQTGASGTRSDSGNEAEDGGIADARQHADALHADDPLAMTAHLQASHLPQVGNLIYGNSLQPAAGLTDILLANFRAVSRRWHSFAGFDDGRTAGKRQRSDSVQSPAATEERASLAYRPGNHLTSLLTARRQNWTWPVILQALQRLFGADATARSPKQQQALVMVARSRPELIVVLPTGGGKSLLFVLPSMLPEAQVTLVITPLVALKQDLCRRCHDWGIAFTVYTPTMALDQAHAVSPLVLVDVQLSSNRSFLAFAQELYVRGRLDRIVLDEAHMVLTASHYRECLPRLSKLRAVGCPFVCMTATLPKLAETELRAALHLTCPETVRDCTDRANLAYQIRVVHRDPRTQTSAESALIDAVVTACSDERDSWPKGSTSERIVCFVRRKATGQVLSERLDCHLYHADVEDRAAVLTAWIAGERSPVIIATAALGAGVDYPHVRLVLHADAPSSLIEYAQQTGRAGRDGRHGRCLTLLPGPVQHRYTREPDRFINNFMSEDCMQLDKFLSGHECLRYCLTSYLDGAEGAYCKRVGVDIAAACSVCLALPEPTQASSTLGAVISPPVAIGTPTNEYPTLCDDEEAEEEAEGEEDEEEEERGIYDAAQILERLDSMQDQEAVEVYMQRVTRWSFACTACSFEQRVYICGDHDNCVQDETACKQFRKSIRLDMYIGCFTCAQPLVVCDRKKAGKCTQKVPELLGRVLSTAVRHDGLALLQTANAMGAGATHANKLAAWIGRKTRWHGLECCNGVRLAHVWLDRLEVRIAANDR